MELALGAFHVSLCVVLSSWPALPIVAPGCRTKPEVLHYTHRHRDPSCMQNYNHTVPNPFVSCAWCVMVSSHQRLSWKATSLQHGSAFGGNTFGRNY